MLEANHYLDGKVRNRTASSRKERTRRHPRSSMNDLAPMVCETMSWPQESNDCVERIYVLAAHHNFYELNHNKQRYTRTHAELAGFNVENIESHKKRFFRERYFYSKLSFNASEWLAWLRAFPTPTRSGWRDLPKYVTCEPRRQHFRRAA